MSRILIVEDEHVEREMMALFLTAQGFDVEEARDGEEGFEIARRSNPNVILSDIAMPGVDGFSFLEKVRSNSDTALTPFIFLTGMSKEISARVATGPEADMYLQKPVLPAELLKTVNSALSRRIGLKK